MSNVKKLMMTAAGGDSLNVEDVFSTDLYIGTGSSQTITNGIDLGTEGGLVWQKRRSGSEDNTLIDSQRGLSSRMSCNNADAEKTNYVNISSFNSDGFTIGNESFSLNNVSGEEYVAWSFRKAPKFFDIVEYSGDNTTSRQISHNLGVAPGVIIIKSINTNQNWIVYHKDLDRDGSTVDSNNLFLNSTGNQSGGGAFGDDQYQTSTYFTLGRLGSGFNDRYNKTGTDYIAYLFAHNDGDGEFGPDGDLDIIKCGRIDFSSDGYYREDLGFKPQWVMLKAITSATQPDWRIIDRTRANGSSNLNSTVYSVSMASGEGSGTNNVIKPNISGAEQSASSYIDFRPDGIYGYNEDDGNDFIYIAIRDTTKPPESGTDVYTAQLGTGSSGTPNLTNIGFNPSLVLRHTTNNSGDWRITTRHTNHRYYNASSFDSTESGTQWDFSGGYYDGTLGSNELCFLFAERHRFMSMIPGNVRNSVSTALTMNHGLGTTPEMIWYQSNVTSTSNGGWYVYHKDTGTARMLLESQGTPTAIGSPWNGTLPTDTQFTIGSSLSLSQRGLGIAFASVAGVSKIDSFTHTNGTATDVDCGFSGGARFVMVKRTDASGDWLIWNSLRGINSGTDPYFGVASGSSEVTTNDYIDPLSSGFQMSSTFTSGTYIFFAVA